MPERETRRGNPRTPGRTASGSPGAIQPPVRQSAQVQRLIRMALAEDIGTGDITSRLVVDAGARAEAQLVARRPGVLCGILVAASVFKAVDTRVRFQVLLQDGFRFRRGTVLAQVSGPARSLLAAERTALNFLQRMSGVATLTRRYVDAISGTGTVILDTRKTLPGWRALDKYAVSCGGGRNHRQGLYDMILIKDNHIQACGSITAALERCRRSRRPAEVETRTLADVRKALSAGARWIMLDNMPLSRIRRAVRLVAGRCRLEASGGITLANVRQVALTGVDFISVGAITHSAPAADIALDFLRPR